MFIGTITLWKASDDGLRVQYPHPQLIYHNYTRNFPDVTSALIA